MIESATTASINGMMAAQNSVAANSDRIAKFAGNTADIGQSIISLIVAKQQLEASVAAFRQADVMQESLLDIIA